MSPPPAHRLLGGAPRKVLVLPGWFGDEALFDPLAPWLDLEQFSYATLAYRGYGAARATAGNYTLDELAADAIALTDALGWDRFAVVGHSMGGKLALLVHARAPGRVAGIMAVTPVPAGAIAFDAAGWQLFAGAATNTADRAAIVNFSTGGKLPRNFANRLAARSAGRSDPVACRAYLDAWANTDITDIVGRSTTPLLALIGANDPQLTETVIRATYLQSFPQGRIGVIADAGHYPIDETPLKFIAAMEQFLADLPWRH